MKTECLVAVSVLLMPLFPAAIGATAPVSNSAEFNSITIKPVTQRPCLLMDPTDLPEVKRRSESMAARDAHDHGKMDSTLHALLYGNDEEKKKETKAFFQSARTIFGGPGKNPLWKERRVNELLFKYDTIASFGFVTSEEQNEFEKNAVEFAKFEIGDDPTKFPSPETPSTNGLEFPQGFSTCNRWPDRFLGAALVGLNFPEQPLAKDWVKYACQQVRFMLEKGNWDGAWNEVPRYHNWTMLLFSTLFEALQRRTGVDFYQDPNTKALLDWYVRFSSPLVRFPSTSKLNPAGEPTLPVWGDSSYGPEFQACALFAPHYAKTDPEFSKRLMWMWRRAGSPPIVGWNFGLYSPMMIDPGLPDVSQILGSDLSRKMGLVLLRSRFDSPDETMVFMRGGEQGATHKRADLASIDFFSQGIPLALGSQSGPYGPGIEWNRDQVSNNDVVFGGKSRDPRECAGKIDAFFSSLQVDYAVADCSRPTSRFVKREESFHWRRHLLLVKNPDYLVVWDEISSPMASEWYLHTTGEKLIWGRNLVTSKTAYNADLDIHVLEPSDPLIPNEKEGRFGSAMENPKHADEYTGKEDPYPFKTLKYFHISAKADQDFLTVLHPRKPDGSPVTSTLLSSSKEKVSLKVTHGDSTDQISVGKDGATFQRDTAPVIIIPMK
ncbi:MAG: hypothetical protein WCO60_00970 [Verrucomicrobiota bacterium]